MAAVTGEHVCERCGKEIDPDRAASPTLCMAGCNGPFNKPEKSRERRSSSAGGSGLGGSPSGTGGLSGGSKTYGSAPGTTATISGGGVPSGAPGGVPAGGGSGKITMRSGDIKTSEVIRVEDGKHTLYPDNYGPMDWSVFEDYGAMRVCFSFEFTVPSTDTVGLGEWFQNG